MSFPRYPKYKDSGVEWLGEVPEHWEICALKRIINMQSGESITAEDIAENGTYPVFGGNGLRGFTGAYTHDGHFVLIGRQGALCGNINYGQGKFWASEHAVVATPVAPTNTVWLGEMLRAMNLNQYAVSAAQPGLSVDQISRLSTAVPSLPEQIQIANFLDVETAKIDALIAEQQRLIELLTEKRQAVISHAVTKGLNPDAPMKPSGVEWLGDVPAHWTVVQSRRHFRLRNERAADGDRQLTASQKHGVIYQDEFMEIEGHRVVQVIKGADILKHVEPDDFVISMRSFQSGIERCQAKGRISSAYVILVPDSHIHGDYFTYLFKSQSYIQALQTTTNLVRDGQALRYDNFTQVSLPLPSLNEQSEIASHIENEITKLDGLVAQSERAIDLLQERRTALISAVVTGQIDVRGAA
jgi:type I restriction enzyme, S subunit